MGAGHSLEDKASSELNRRLTADKYLIRSDCQAGKPKDLAKAIGGRHVRVREQWLCSQH